METSEIIKNTEEFEKFREHLSIPNNSRIIFSGKFGIGKTTFLKEFFAANSQKYTCINLYPINYSISPNEDILDLLKYDIISELINCYPVETEEYDFNDSSVLSGFVKADFDNFFTTILELIPKVGKHISSSYKSIIELVAKYKEFKEQINSGDLTALQKLLDSVECKRGNFYQHDFYTNFIAKKLEEVTIKEPEKKENVLIIDDLDRIDPEHIFRLFNVFAAHLHGSTDEANKFGFDKIIFSCDIDNIEAIYHHKYGKNADFTGYIDKFYSNSIYNIDNRSAVKYWIEKKLPIENDRPFRNGEIEFITDTLNNMLKCGVLNFRNIKSINADIVTKGLEAIDRKNVDGGVLNGTLFIWVMPILSAISGSPEFLIEKLHKCKEIIDTRTNNSFGNLYTTTYYVMQFLLPVALYQKHGLNRNKKFVLHLNIFNQEYNTYFEYTLKNDGFIRAELITTNETNIPSKIIPNESTFNDIIWDLFIKAVKETKERGYCY